MELDAEGGISFEQLKDLIKKECDKRDKKYRFLEQNYNKLQELLEHSQQQKNANDGPTRRLEQEEITTDKPAKGDQPMRPLYFATTPLTTCQTKRKSQRYQQRRNTRKFGKAEKEQALKRSQQNKKPTSSDWNRSRQPSKTK